jgi:hypothetical protein
LEEVLNHPWFADFKDIHDLRANSSVTGGGDLSKFAAYTLTEPHSPKLKEELEKYSH